MLVESLKSLKVTLPTGEAVHLKPGQPVEMPDEHARRLLAKAPNKVRLVEPQSPKWLTAWRGLAALTDGITQEDPRFQPLLDGLTNCDLAFERGDWPGFEQAVDQVRRVVRGRRS